MVRIFTEEIVIFSETSALRKKKRECREWLSGPREVVVRAATVPERARVVPEEGIYWGKKKLPRERRLSWKALYRDSLSCWREVWKEDMLARVKEKQQRDLFFRRVRIWDIPLRKKPVRQPRQTV